MDDLISRQAALDEAFEIDTKEYGRIDVVGVDAIDTLPPVTPQPKIIRCKDCKHWAKTEGDERWSIGDCSFLEKRLVMCEGYCAWAERKE